MILSITCRNPKIVACFVWVVLTVFPVIATVQSEASELTTVPINHPVYRYLQRMEAFGYLRDLQMFSYPHTRETVFTMLNEIAKATHPDAHPLSAYDQWYLDKYRGEFAPPYQQKTSAAQPERHLLTYETAQWYVSGDLHTGLRTSGYTQKLPLHQFALGGEVRTTYLPREASSSMGGFIRLRTLAENARYRSQSNFDPSEGPPVIVDNGIASKNDLQTAVLYQSGFGLFMFGQDHRKWGRGEIDALQLGNTTPEFDYFRFVTHLRALRFTFLTGALRSSLGEKYLAGHRLEWQPVRWMQLAISETIIYGDPANDRGMEFTYLNPLIPYVVSEPYAGDQDNNTSAVELTLYPVTGVQLYTQLLIDDINLTESFTGYFGNKWGFLAGVYTPDPLGFNGSSATMEYVRIEPWVYTNDEPINTYSHLNVGLGYPLQPNSDRCLFSYTHALSFRTHLTTRYMLTRHGTGDIDTPPPKGAESKRFLQGYVSPEHRFEVTVDHEYFQSSFVGVFLFLEKDENSQNLLGGGILVNLNY